MKHLILLLSIFCFSNDTEYLYWENLNLEVQNETLNNPKVDPIVLQYYYGENMMLDCNTAIVLIKKLSELSDDLGIRALYFDLFNNICANSDGELSEYLSSYCYKLLLDNPVYVITYLEKKPDLLAIYGEYIGYQLYFAETLDTYSEVLGNNILKYSHFKQSIDTNILEYPTLKDTSNLLFSRIKSAMRDMD